MRLLFYCFFFAFIASTLGTWTINHYEIPCDTKELSLNFSATGNATFFSTFYCFGEFDGWSAYNDIATTDSNPQLWDPNVLETTVIYNGTGYVNFLWKAKNTYNGTACATFDHAVYQYDDELPQHYVTIDEDDRAPSGKLSNGGKDGVVTWKKTSDSSDTYSLYWTNTQTAPSGQNFATACSVRAWMNNFTSDQGTFDTSGATTVTATVTNLDPKQPFTVVLVASRGSDTVANVYDSISLNGKSDGSALLPSVLVVMVAFVVVLW